MRAQSLILVILLFFPVVSAIGNVELYRNGQPLQYVQFGQQIPVELRFTLDEGVNRVRISYRGGTTQVGATSCSEERRCSTQINLNPQATNTFGFELQGSQEIIEYTITLREDTVTPRIVSWDIAGCTRQCAIGAQSPLTVRVLEAPITEGIQVPEGIRVSYQNIIQPSQGPCTMEDNAHVCNFLVNGNPTGEEIVISATDLAGNEAVERIQVSYDGTPPVITSEIVFADRGNDIPTGTPITVEARVQEDFAARARIEFPEEFNIIVESELCQRDDDSGDYACAVTFPAPLVPPQQITAEFIVSDNAGNEDRESFTFSVVEGDSEVQTNFWRESSLRINGQINPFFWQVSDQRIPVRATFTKTGSNSAILVDVDVNTCQLYLGEQNTPRQVQLSRPPTVTGNSAEFVVIVPQIPSAEYTGDSMLFDAELRCEFSLTSRFQNTVYLLPEIVSGQESLRYEGELPLPGEAVQQLSDRAREAVISKENTLAKINAISNIGLQLCTQNGYISGTAGALSLAADSITVLTLGTGSQVAQKLDASAIKLDILGDTLGTALGPICRAMTCQPVVDFYGGLTDNVLDAGGVGGIARALGGAPENASFQSLLNPYSSVFVAYATMCVPAIQYHLNVIATNQCVLATCLERMSDTGALPGDCNAAYSQATCVYNAGAIYNAVPIVNVWNNIVNQWVGVLDNPLGVFGLVNGVWCAVSSPHGLVRAGIPYPARLPCQAIDYVEKVAQVGSIVGDARNGQLFTQGIGANYPPACQDRLNAPIRPPSTFPYQSQFEGCYPGFSETEIDGVRYIQTGPTEKGSITQCRGVVIGGGANDQPLSAEAYAAGCKIGSQEGITDNIREQVAQRHEQCQQGQFEGLYSSSITEEINIARQAKEDLREDLEIIEANRDVALIQFQEGVSDAVCVSCDDPVNGVLYQTTFDATINLASRIRTPEDAEAVHRMMQLNPELYDQELRYRIEALSQNFQENIDGIQREIAAQDEFIKEKREQLKEEAFWARWSARGDIQTVLASATAWSSIGTVTFNLFDFDVADSIGYDGVRDFVHNTLGELDLTDYVAETYCSNRESTQTDESTIAFTGQGNVDARLAAVGRQVETESGTREYQYIISVFLNARGEGEAQVVSQPQINNPEAEFPRVILLNRAAQLVGSRAITFSSTTRLSRVCIEFPESLDTYFTAIEGLGNMNRRDLCFEVDYQ